MTADLSMDRRAAVLRYASALLPEEDRANPVRVGQAALPLLEWAEKAPDRRDLSARMRAMSLQHFNRRRPAEGGPAAFVEAAKAYYDFLAAGPDGDPASADYATDDPGLAARLDAVARKISGSHGDGSQDS